MARFGQQVHVYPIGQDETQPRPPALLSRAPHLLPSKHEHLRRHQEEERGQAQAAAERHIAARRHHGQREPSALVAARAPARRRGGRGGGGGVAVPHPRGLDGRYRLVLGGESGRAGQGGLQEHAVRPQRL
eukprot:3279898-Prymnesium_polylepis.2